MGKLDKGFEYKEKLAFFNSTNSPNTYIYFLNQIMGQEHEVGKGKCIFKFDENQIASFCATVKPGSYKRTMSSVLNNYFKYYIINIDSNIENNICKALKNFEISKQSYQDTVGKYVTSINDLINCLRKFSLDKRSLLTALLAYIGFSSEEIIELKVANIDFLHKKITYLNRTYSNVDYKILNIINNNILDSNNENELLIKSQKELNKVKSQTVTSLIDNINTMAISEGLDKKLNYKALREGGYLSYYCTHENEFLLKDNVIPKIKLFKLFGVMKNTHYNRVSICTRDFKKKLEIFKDLPIDLTKMFDGDIEVTEAEIIEYNKKSNKNQDTENSGETDDFLNKISKSFPEKVKGNKDNGEPWWTRLKKIGNKNEELVKESLTNYIEVSDIETMDDSSGFDLRFKLNNKIYRFEVKTLNEDLEFYISINEINSIFDERKGNYSIAVVKDEKIYILEDVYNTLGLDKNFIYNIYSNGKIEIATETFIVRLDKNMFKTLKSIRQYINNIKLK